MAVGKNPVTMAELCAWHRIAQLRQVNGQMHKNTQVGDFNNRFGVVMKTWKDVELHAQKLITQKREERDAPHTS